MEEAPEVQATIDEPRRRRVPRWVWGVAAALAAVGGIAAAQVPLVSAYVRHRATKLGVDLGFAELELRRDAVRLREATATLDGVRGVELTAGRFKLRTSGLEVASVDASEVRVEVEGSPTDRLLELSTWASEHGETYRLPGSARDVQARWRAAKGAAPWFTATGGSLDSDGREARITASSASLGGVALGAVSATFAVGQGAVTLELGKGASGEAPVRASLTTGGPAPRLDLTLRPVHLDALGAALGVSAPVPGAVASGQAQLTLGGSGAAATGSASLLLEGWVPPHPRELDGVVSGKRTTISAAKISVAADHGRITLGEVVVRAGKLELKGSGTVAREADHTVAQLDLGGPVACADLARNVAKKELGFLGEIAGDLAQGAVVGSVRIDVAIEIDSRDPKNPKVKPRVGVGCKLKLF
jgi:hypothetical protein